MKLSIITVTYNSEKFIKKFLDSILANLPGQTEIIIVDSRSQDRTVDIIKQYQQKFPRDIPINLKISKQNIGYGKGNNLAAKTAKGEYLLILNPDTQAFKESVIKLLEFARKHQEAGIVAPKLIQDNGNTQPSVRKLPTVWGAISEYYLGNKNAYEAYSPTKAEFSEHEAVVGAAILIRKDIFIKVGGFDEKYFMYFEDLDLCRKVLDLGLKIYYLPQAVFKHTVGASTGKIPEQSKKWLQESAIVYHGRFKAALIYYIMRIHQLFFS